MSAGSQDLLERFCAMCALLFRLLWFVFFNPIIAQFHSSPVIMCLNTLSSSPSLHKRPVIRMLRKEEHPILDRHEFQLFPQGLII